MSERQLYLLDAMALAYRAYFAFISTPRINSRGTNTSAVYGFTTAVLKLIGDFGMQYAGVVFDAAGPTFRSDIYPDYKAHRDPPPEALIENLPYIKEVTAALGITMFEVPGVEADDVIGTLARRAEQAGCRTIIVSPDKDFQQLLGENISQFKPTRSGEVFDPITASSFQDKYGITPAQFVDVLALMGDRADNVPGVPGIGEKTAVKLIAAFGSVENLLDHASAVKGKRAREGLTANGDLARLSKQLVTINTDLDVPLDWSALERIPLTLSKVAPVFRRLEFNTLLKRLQGEGSPEEPEVDVVATDLQSYDESASNYRLITKREDLEALEKTLSSAPAIGLHALTGDGPPAWADWVGLSVSWAEATACYVPVPLPDGTGASVIATILAPVLTNSLVRKVGHAIKPLLFFLARNGVHVRGPLFDTEVAHYLLRPETNHGLRFVAKQQLGYEPIDLDGLLGTGRQRRSPRDLSPSDLTTCACEQAALPLQIASVLESELTQKGVDRVASVMEFPLVYVLAAMEEAGIVVDIKRLNEIDAELAVAIEELEKAIYEAAGRQFNIGSSQQVGAVLFDELGLPALKKTPKGKPSTREEALLELATEHHLPGLILDWRQASKLRSTYISNLSRLVRPESGRVHSVFNQTVAATGRLSSSDPGLQNIPVRRAQGRQLRRAFVAPLGCVLLSADYSQIELRILAHMSGDPGLVEAFRAGLDIHVITAAKMKHVAPDEITPRLRNDAKEVNYGIPYGLSPFGLAQRLRRSRAEAAALIAEYHATYPGIAPFLSRQVALARERGYAETLWGRRRYLPSINARNRMERAAAERIAINMPIQGTQADMIKLAMVAIHRRIRHEGYATRLLLQVHDELVFEVPIPEIGAIHDLVTEEMVQALPLDVPVEVAAQHGPTWFDAH